MPRCDSTDQYCYEECTDTDTRAGDDIPRKDGYWCDYGEEVHHEQNLLDQVYNDLRSVYAAQMVGFTLTDGRFHDKAMLSVMAVYAAGSVHETISQYVLRPFLVVCMQEPLPTFHDEGEIGGRCLGVKRDDTRRKDDEDFDDDEDEGRNGCGPDMFCDKKSLTCYETCYATDTRNILAHQRVMLSPVHTDLLSMSCEVGMSNAVL